MQIAKATGPRAASLKYDILTALLVLGQADSGVDGRLASRLALLITARFSWRTETFRVGVRELGQLWSVTERTAKRELAQMRAKGWVSVARAATRGRVAEHRIHLDVVLAATRGSWAAVGPDFEERMGQGGQTATAPQTVVPFPGKSVAAPVADGSGWAAVSSMLHDSDPSAYAAWFAKLQEVSCHDGVLVLAAPSAFVRSYVENHLRLRLLGAVTATDGGLREVRVIC